MVVDIKLCNLRNENNTKFQYPKLQGPISSNCQYCGTSYNVAGPMYAGNLHNREFIDKVLKINESSDKEIYATHERIKGMLTLASNELDDAPFFFNLNQLCSIFKFHQYQLNNIRKQSVIWVIK